MTAVLTPAPVLGPHRGARLRKAKNSLATVLVTAAFLIALVPLVWLLWTVLAKGFRAVTRNGWWTSDQGVRTFADPGGGVLHGILGTLEQVAITTVLSVPIALLVAVYLVEYGEGRLARITTFMVDILSGLPSIVAALFIYAIFFVQLGAQFAGVWVSLALVLLMIPVVVRTTEELLRLVPNELREAAYALGIPKWKTILKVVLPTAFAGIITGIVLGVARVAGETAPLLILDSYQKFDNANPLSGAQAALPLVIRDQVFNLGVTHTFTGGVAANYAPERMWGAALTLIVIVMLLNLLARLIGRFNKIAN